MDQIIIIVTQLLNIYLISLEKVISSIRGKYLGIYDFQNQKISR